MILEQIKKDNVIAIKERNAVARSIYSIIMNKAILETVNKRLKNEPLNDTDMLLILQKTVKELNEEREGLIKGNYLDRVAIVNQQIEIVEKYLPKMLSEDEIKDIISKLDDKSIPSVMKHFKMQYAGKCDNQKVLETLKKYY